MPRRAVPLIVVASPSASVAEEVAARLRRDGNVVYVAHTAQACLRVATSVTADVVLIDAAFPARLETLLRAHPISRQSQILHLNEESSVPRTAPRVLHAA